MKNPARDRLPTGIEGLDLILGGGLVPGCAYIVQGPPGAGKTILANQVCFTLARYGKRALYVTLLAQTHDRLLAHMSSLDFFALASVPHDVSYISAYDTMESETASSRLSGLLRLIHAEICRHNASVLVLDGLFVARDAAADEQEFRAFVHELQEIAGQYECAFLLLTIEGQNQSAEQAMVDGGIELLDEIHGARSVRTMIVKKQRGAAHVGGRHQYRITEAGIRVFPRIEAVLTRTLAVPEETTRVSTGIRGFDEMIGEGYLVGSANVLAGPSGTGKTTMGLQFLSRATVNEPGLLFGLYETPAQLLTKARSIGIDIDRLIASGALEIIWHPPAENLLDELGHKLLDAVERRKVKRVFFDGMEPLRQSFLFPARMPLFIGAINNRLRERTATVTYSLELPTLYMPDQISKYELSNMVENVVLTYYVKPLGKRDGQGPTNAVDRELLVLKIRDSAFDAYPETYRISSDGVCFGRTAAIELRPKHAHDADVGT